MFFGISASQKPARAFQEAAVVDVEHRYRVLERSVYPRSIVVGRKLVPDELVRDPDRGRTFRSHLDVLVEDSTAGGCICRFRVHAPDMDVEPTARKVGLFLGILWGMADQRFGRLNSRLRSGPLDVWMCRDAGPESAQQSRRNLYILDALGDRTGIEWARTLAHEFGHFILPGPSGYKEPESWANGVFGERLFLSWLRDDVVAGKVETSLLPFVTRSSLEDYCTKQPDALVNRVMSRGPDRSLLAESTKMAMDEGTALLLYISRVHGSAALQEILVYLPVRASREPTALDMLAAYERWVSDSGSVQYTVPVGRPVFIYLPSGRTCISFEGGLQSELKLSGGAQQRMGNGSVEVAIPKDGWFVLKINGPDTVPAGATLTVRKC